MSLFFVTFIGFVLSIILLIIRERFFSIFLGWEGLGVSSFLLVIFYQNWTSAKGGLLTMLTNRLGDAVLIINFSYWSLSINLITSLSSAQIILLLIVLLALTKRAQWPFSRWLPAAIAAPTPVRALVHSSTLVTAGIWLIVRFGQTNIILSSLWLILGRLTLLIARFAALIEKDGKKIVALSTLSQLGLLFMSMRLGSIIICLIHIITHALAKASLFIIVGNLLHSFYSEQDARQVSSSRLNLILIITIARIISLSGILFRSGFFSKEIILSKEWTLLSRIITMVIILGVARLTFTYCTKILLLLEAPNKPTKIEHNAKRKFSNISPLFLRLTRIVSGFWMVMNTKRINFIQRRKTRILWVIPFLGFFLLINEKINSIAIAGFTNISWVIENVKNKIGPVKQITKTLENATEKRLITFTLSTRTLVTQPVRTLVMARLLIIVLTLL